MKLDPDDVIGWTFVGCIVVLAVLALSVLGYAVYCGKRDSDAKFDCRKRGGTVVSDDNHDEWHCSSAPEHAP